MAKTIFFSWQADRPSKTCRNFIESSLERAIGILHKDLPVEEAEREEIQIDRDTKGVGGMPPIVETIFKKIDGASIFIADLTFVGERADGRPTPNPNVLIEYGWALHGLTYNRIIAVMNAAYGEPSAQTLPFDMQHLRHPITFNVPDDASPELRKAEKDRLTKILAGAIKDILADEDEQVAPLQPQAVEPFVPMQAQNHRARFRVEGERIGVQDDPLSTLLKKKPEDVHLFNGPAYWLRVMPAEAQTKQWSVPEIEKAGRHNGQIILPMGEGYRNFGLVRAGDGWGCYAMPFNGESETKAVVMAFKSGEVWTIDTYPAQAIAESENSILLPEPYFVTSLPDLVAFLRRLGVEGPLRWEAGLEGVLGRTFSLTTRKRIGPFLNDIVLKDGPVLDGEPAKTTLKPFFDDIYAECGVLRE